MGWEDAPIVQAAAPRQPWEDAPIVRPAGPRTANGFLDALEAGWQGSATGLALRMRLPDVVLDHTNAKWYEKVAAAGAQMVSEIPEMVVGAVAGGAAGTAGGAAVGSAVPVVGTIAGGAVGGILGTGAGAFAVPAAIRESLIQAYTANEVGSSGDFLSRATIVLKTTGKEGLIGAATFGMGAAAKLGTATLMGAGSAAGAIGTGAATMATRGGQAVVGTAGTAAELGTMVVTPAALEGRLPEPEDFLNAAILLAGAKGAAVAAGKLQTIYARTGKTPEEVVAEAKADPTIAAEVAKPEVEIPTAYVEAARQENARNAVPGEKAEQVAAQPFADIPQAKGEPALPTHINYNYINTADDVAGAMSRLSEVYKADIEAQRRGTVTWEQTSQEAAKILSDTLGVADSSLMLPREPGTAAGAAEILARKQLTIGAAEDMMRARDNLLNKGLEATTQDRFEFLAAIERAAMIQSEFLGARAEAGRALNILKESRVEADRAKLVLEVIERYGKDPMELARMLKEIDNPAGALKFAEKATKATTWEKVVEAWKAGLVSGPITHVANTFGNTTFLALRVPVDAVAAGFGLLRSGPDKVVASESLARIAGAMHGTIEGLKTAGAILRTGEYDISTGKADAHRRAIPGATGEVVRLPFRLLAAEDALFRAMNERGELYAMAMREARGQGLNPATREFREKVAELVNNPNADMQKAIEKAGERFTFNSPLGAKGQAVQEFVRAWHLEWAVPFIRTPGNVMKELARLTPAAPLVKEWRDALAKGGAEADKALAEVVVGSAIASTAMAFAFDGAISGAGDPDPAKKRVAAAAGWQPYSVKIGDTWYSYQRLQPVGTLIGLAADMSEAWDHMNEEESDKLPKMLSVAFANAVTNQTFLQGIANIVNAMSDPTRFGPRFVQGLAASTVPAVVSQTAQLNDLYVREIESVLDAVKNRVPGLRESLLPSRDVFGEPRQNRDRLGIVSPIVTSTESPDPVRKEAMRLGVAVAKAPDKINLPAGGDRKLGKVELTPEQQDVFATVSGQMAHRIMSDIINSGTWERMPDMVKRRTFDIVFERARKAGRAEALPLDQREKEAERIANELRDRLGY